jgi:predicted nucleotidyltransferase
MVSAIASPAALKHDGGALADSAQPRIQSLLDRIEAERGIRILYACESGSRAWGFASPDSDYDIRFLFAHPEKAYLQVLSPCDTIDLPLLDGDLDAGGWDVRKALGLLGKSNGALVEWLHSPIIYRQTPGFLDRWRMTAREVFSPKHSVDHYRGLAKQMVFGKLHTDAVRAKDYLYALRAILAAEWVLDGRGIPPVPFAELLSVAPREVRDLVPELLEHKARTMEGERMARMPVLDAFLDRCLTDSAGRSALLNPPPDARSSLDRLFRRVISVSAPELAADYTLDRVRRADVLLFETVAGSRAYGTDLERSDEDLRGVFVASNAMLGGLDRIEQVSDERGDLVYYELGRLVELLLRNNPNALELIAMPEDCVRFRHPLFERLRPSLFLSKLCARTYDSKNLMHTIRLLEMAGEIAREGVLRVRRPNRDFLLEIRAGEFSYDQLVSQAEDLHAGLDAVFAASSLPDEPDRAAVNALLVELREEFRTS